MHKYIISTLAVLLVSQVAYAAPDSTMSVTPSASSGQTITASDENSRNNSIATTFNSHSHTDISQVGNSLTVGDGTAGDKDMCANAADATDRCIRWDDSEDLWVMQQGSDTYNSALVSSGTTGLTGGGIVFANGDAVLNATNPLANGELLIGDGSGVPTLANLTAGAGISVTNGTGSITLASFSQSTIVDFTRTTGQSTGSQAYTGMGFEPTSLVVVCTENSATARISIGVADDADGEASVFSSGASVAFSYDTSQLIRISDGTNAWGATLTTLDSDGFTLSWTKTSSGLNLDCSALGVR